MKLFRSDSDGAEIDLIFYSAGCQNGIAKITDSGKCSS